MARLSIGDAARLIGVSADTVRRLADAGALASTRSAGGRRLLETESVAAYLRNHAPQPPAEPVYGQSARNRMPGIVTRVVRDTVMAQVDVQAGPHRIVSLMTREAADELGLEPGSVVVAAVKATNVVIETGEPSK
jgi:molybdopterin-binding protein